MAKWVDRTIRGPDEDYLTREDVAKLFGVSVDWLADQEEAGVLPQPTKLSQRTIRYTWEHVIFISLWFKFQTPVKDIPKGKLTATGGN